MKPPTEKDKALDRVIFGTNQPDSIQNKLDEMAQFLAREESSLGLSLAGIRHRESWTLQQVSAKVGVSVRQWQAWEADFETPDPEQLRTVLERLDWSREVPRFLELRKNAPKVRLKRMANVRPETLAARGLAGISGSYEWQSLDPELQQSLKSWGGARGLSFPEDLMSVLADFTSEEEREAWITEVLEGPGE